MGKFKINDAIPVRMSGNENYFSVIRLDKSEAARQYELGYSSTKGRPNHRNSSNKEMTGDPEIKAVAYHLEGAWQPVREVALVRLRLDFEYTRSFNRNRVS